MSSDLLGAFGQCAEPVQKSLEVEEEDFGEFEDAHEDAGITTIGQESRFVDLPRTNESFADHENDIKPQVQGVMFDAEQEVEDLKKMQHTKATLVHTERKLDVRLLPRETAARTTGISSATEDWFDEDEQWDPIGSSQTTMIPSKVSTIETMKNPIAIAETPIERLGQSKSSQREPAPTNIPPPSILLACVASSFGSLTTGLSAIITRNDVPKASSAGLNHSKMAEIHRLMGIVRSGARIIAGRKLRWKRDIALAQSMRIGTAGQGGMKLSSVDKNETRREEQEVAEAVSIWRRQIGPLRSLVAKANASFDDDGITLPDVNEMIPVRQGKPGEGAVKASKCCFLCGINRDERTAKVDLYVEDSFGEWWIDYWGHADCVNFWDEWESQLRQR